MDLSREMRILLEVRQALEEELGDYNIEDFGKWAFGEDENIGMMPAWNLLHSSELELNGDMCVYDTLPQMVAMYKKWKEEQEGKDV